MIDYIIFGIIMAIVIALAVYYIGRIRNKEKYKDNIEMNDPVRD